MNEIGLNPVLIRVLEKLGRPLNEEEISKLKKELGISPESRNEEYQRWSLDSVFMSVAYTVAKSSHDSNTQHGAVIVDRKNHIVSTGCNGFLSGALDDVLPNERENGFKYEYVMHAERNALDQATKADLSDCRIYVTGVSCNTCLKGIIAKGIKEIIVGDVGHVYAEGFWEMQHFLCEMHNVQVRRFSGIIVDTSVTREIIPYEQD